MQHQKSVRGNVLFMILVGVALFAALTYAVSYNRSAPVTMATREQSRLIAQELIAYGNGLRPIIQRMTMLGGVSDNNIWFAASTANAAYGTVGANPSAEVFNPSGGGASYIAPPAGACLSTCAYEFSGQFIIPNLGSGAKPLVMVVFDIDPDVCQAVNTLLDIGSSIPTGPVTTLTRFDGNTYGAAPILTMTNFSGKQAFCYKENGGANRYIFLQVIRTR